MSDVGCINGHIDDQHTLPYLEISLPLPRGLDTGKVPFQTDNFRDRDIYLQPRIPTGILNPKEVEPAIGVITVGQNEVHITKTESPQTLKVRNLKQAVLYE